MKAMDLCSCLHPRWVHGRFGCLSYERGDGSYCDCPDFRLGEAYVPPEEIIEGLLGALKSLHFDCGVTDCDVCAVISRAKTTTQEHPQKIKTTKEARRG